MESVIVETLLNPENVRMAILLVFGYFGYKMLNMSFDKKLNERLFGVESSLNKRIDGVEARIDEVEASLNKKIDGVEASLLSAMDEKMDTKLAAFHAQLKANDFAHLNNTIEALTFMLEKNKFLEKEDREYINKMLDR